MRRFEQRLLIPALGWVLASGVSCARKVKAEFPRPPAVVTEAGNAPDAEEPTPEPDNVAEPPAEPVDAKPELDEEPEPPPPEQPKPPPRRTPKAEPEPEELPPEPPPKASRSEPPPAPSPIQGKLDKAGELLTTVSSRLLTSVQRDQVNAASGFIMQAQEALLDGDDRRALVLADKGLILIDDVERASRR